MKLARARIAVVGPTAPTGGRPDSGAAAQPSRARRIVRFAALELALWAALYGAYLAIRGLTIGDRGDALGHASDVVDLERAAGVFHEGAFQAALGSLHDFFSAYYMLGFAPLLGVVLVWLGLRRPDVYRQLRTVLLISIGIATIAYVLFPTAPPRLMPELGIDDTVGLSTHDTGSFAGIRFNPYAAVPSMHVGWSLLVGLYGLRAASGPLLRGFFFLHPAVMAVAVTATGNHYFFDSVAGIAVALLAVSATRLFQPSSESPRVRPCRNRLTFACQEA